MPKKKDLTEQLPLTKCGKNEFFEQLSRLCEHYKNIANYYPNFPDKEKENLQEQKSAISELINVIDKTKKLQIFSRSTAGALLELLRQASQERLSRLDFSTSKGKKHSEKLQQLAEGRFLVELANLFIRERSGKKPPFEGLFSKGSFCGLVVIAYELLVGHKYSKDQAQSRIKHSIALLAEKEYPNGPDLLPFRTKITFETKEQIKSLISEGYNIKRAILHPSLQDAINSKDWSPHYLFQFPAIDDPQLLTGQILDITNFFSGREARLYPSHFDFDAQYKKWVSSDSNGENKPPMS